MKKLLLSICSAAIAGSAGAQVYLADTAMTTDRGAGSGKASSMFKPNGTLFGTNATRNLNFSIAEDFVVPAGQTWNVDTIIVYGYQTNSGTTPTINSVTMQLRQSTVTGTSLYGDTTTNRLTSAVFTGIYRVDTAAASGGVTSTMRPIMALKVKITPTLSLAAGTYWVIWRGEGSSTLTGPWANPKVNPGRVNPSGQNGQQRTAGVWRQAKDSVSSTMQSNVGYPLMIKGPAKTAVASLATIDAGLQCAPNPSKGASLLSFELMLADEVSLRILTTTGQLVKQIEHKELPAGPHQYRFDAGTLPAGQYICELQTTAGRQTRVFQVLK